VGANARFTLVFSNPKACLDMKHVLIASGMGLLLGLLCLVQVLGVFTWIPAGLFRGVHAPATFVSGLFVHGEGAWSVIPVAVVLQWVFLGAIIGLILHLAKGPKP
jgi:hypothetical protein